MADFVPQSDFDFSVRLSTHTMTLKAGQTVRIPIMVEAVKGEPRPILLTASDWRSAGLSADIAPPTIPSGGTATLYVTVPAGTAPGSYLFTVRGSTEGTFKTSNDSITVIVEPEREEKDRDDRPDAQQDRMGQEKLEESVVSASPGPVKRASLFRSTKKTPARPMPAGQRVLFLAIMFVMIGVLVYYVGATLRSSSGGSSSGMSGTYVGTSTFCIGSVLGGSPECGTSTTPEIQIGSAGDVLGPVLFGKIDADNSFDGEARAGDGTTFPMSGTYSNGTLTVEYRSSSVTWTITLRRQ